jgi:tetratricopeptide (TPR) repeat protein
MRPIDWTAAEKILDFLVDYTQPEDKFKAERIGRQLVLGLRPPWPLRWFFYRNFPEFRRLSEWRDSMQTSFYIDCRYNYAVACFMSFRPAGLLEAIETAGDLKKRLASKETSIKDPNRSREMRALAACLEIQSAAVFLRGLRRFETIAECQRVCFKKEHEIREHLEALEKEHGRELTDWMSRGSAAVRATAHKTLGMLTMHRFPHQVETAAPYFESALEIQPSVNAYVYLAETRLKQDPVEARKLLELALKLSPRHAFARLLLAELKVPGQDGPGV